MGVWVKVFFFVLQTFYPNNRLMSGSAHISSVLIGVEYRNCCRTLDVYLLFAIRMGQESIKTDL